MKDKRLENVVVNGLYRYREMGNVKKIPMRRVLSIPLMSGFTSLHSMLAMEEGAKSVVCHCDIRDGYCRWAQATQEPPVAMGGRVLYCAVAYSIECEEGKRSDG